MESYTGEKHWEQDFKQINQMTVTKQVTRNYPPVFLTVGDADPFESQSRALERVLKSNNVPVETSYFDGTHKQASVSISYEIKGIESNI